MVNRYLRTCDAAETQLSDRPPVELAVFLHHGHLRFAGVGVKVRIAAAERRRGAVEQERSAALVLEQGGQHEGGGEAESGGEERRPQAVVGEGEEGGGEEAGGHCCECFLGGRLVQRSGEVVRRYTWKGETRGVTGGGSHAFLIYQPSEAVSIGRAPRKAAEAAAGVQLDVDVIAVGDARCATQLHVTALFRG